MNLYFFYKNESNDSWYDCTIEAWEENDNTYQDGRQVSSFRQLERLRLHICKSPFNTNERKRYHSARFDHDFSTDSCMGHNAKCPKEFLEEQRGDYSRLKTMDHKTFHRFKKVMFRIYEKYPPVNYTERLLKEAPVTRILC